MAEGPGNGQVATAPSLATSSARTGETDEAYARRLQDQEAGNAYTLRNINNNVIIVENPCINICYSKDSRFMKDMVNRLL
jgi:hypothetical protein